MVLHRLTAITVEVPDVAATAAFYRDFGLSEVAPGRFASADGGEQLRLEQRSRPALVELGLGVDDGDDLDRLASSVAAAGFRTERHADGFVVEDPAAALRVQVDVAPRLPASTNGAGPGPRVNQRAPAVDRDDPVRPRRLGHVVIGSPDAAATRRLFVDGFGFAVSDEIAGIAAFLRCSTDHHNVLVQAAPAPFLHHTSWQVDDADEVGRGGNAMVADPERHLWGLGRHYIGSNWFWYLRDPAGHFAEYYADMDVITDAAAWSAMAAADRRALYAWAPPVPDAFLAAR